MQTESQLKDFAKANLGLFWQKQATIAGATLLAAVYVDIYIALMCYGFCQLAEILDFRVSHGILQWGGRNERQKRFLVALLVVTSAASSMLIVQYALLIALEEGPSMHIGPLFFLVAAALYAAMNNCQVPIVLKTRMVIYTAALIFIPAYDLWQVHPPLKSALWGQMGVVLFVLYFVFECARQLLRNYDNGLAQFEELRIERDRVEKAFRVQREFVRVVSHELRTPLTTIAGSLELINSGRLGEVNEPISQASKLAHESSMRLSSMVDNLLDFQKYDTGKLNLQLSTIDLTQLVREAVAVNAAMGVHRNVTIKVNDEDSLVPIKGDYNRLLQVLGNVLSNAIKFSQMNGVVEVTVDSSYGKGCVFIKDEGVGIPTDSHERVFRPFSQVDNSDNRMFEGTGLGLSISRQIMDGHGGAIDYVSEVGEGSIFKISLDLATITESSVISKPFKKRAISVLQRREVPQVSSMLNTPAVG